MNTKIEEYLQYYLDGDNNFGYAVLLDGKWGSGKTWFIKKLIDKYDPEGKDFLLMSLYGMDSVVDIQEEFFRVVHPILSSKPVSIATGILKTMVKSSVSLDFFGDSTKDVNLNVDATGIKFFDFLKIPDRKLLIFDDLERTSIPYDVVLGFINNLVENGGYKVIIIANEMEITGKDEKYKFIKEKLIGRTFRIEPNINEFLNHTISEIRSLSYRIFIENYKIIISELFVKSTCNNLRILKHSIQDFEILYQCISPKAHACEQLTNALVQAYFIFSFEIKSGNLSPKDIPKIRSNRLTAAVLKKDPNAEFSCIAKYPEFNIYNTILQDELWSDIFTTGLVDTDTVKNEVDGSHYLYDQNSPAWKRLWWFRGLSEDERKQLIRTVNVQIKNKEIENQYVVMHIAGIFINLAINGIIKDNVEKVVSTYKSYIEYLSDKNLLTKNIMDMERLRKNGGYDGLGYTAVETNEFNDIRDYLYNLIDQIDNKSAPKQAQAFFEMLTNEPSVAITRLSSHGDFFTRVPIFSLLNSRKLVNIIQNLTWEDQIVLQQSLQARYQIISDEIISKDFDSLNLLSEKLIVRSKYLPTMKSFNMRELANTIRSTIGVQSE